MHVGFWPYFPTSHSTRCGPMIHKWPKAYKQKCSWWCGGTAPTCFFSPSSSSILPLEPDATILNHEISVTHSSNKVESQGDPDLLASLA